MRFHIVSLPHTQTTKEYSWCAYTEKVRKFCNMMMNIGHEVFLYASEDNEANCTEFITLVTKEEQNDWFGHLNWNLDLFPNGGWEPECPWWKVMNSRAINEIKLRLEAKDIIGMIMGRSQGAIYDEFNATNICVEWGIGYEGVYSQHRVFESYAWMHHVYGICQQRWGSGNDAVIPNSFEPDDFPVGDGSGEYFLYLGRLVPNKGPQIASQVCQEIGANLKVAGQGGTVDEYGVLHGIEGLSMYCENMEYVGKVGPSARSNLIGKAKALFVPTIYIEPFGGVAVEAMMCGTPVITSDWGAFTETVHHGYTGFRCRTINEFIDAAYSVSDLDRLFIREHAMRYSTDNIMREYDYYFERILG